MKSMIALFALLAVAAATDYTQWTGVGHQKSQRYGAYGVAGYGSGITGYGIGYPSTYGNQIYGQSYYNPITYGSYGARPVSDYTYGYNTPAHTYGSVGTYGLGRVGAYDHVGTYGVGRQAYGVQPVAYNTYSSVQPIASKAYTTGHHVSQPAFTSYFHRGAENFAVKPEISHVADLSYKTVQQPIVETIEYKPVVQQPIVDTIAYKPIVQQPIVSDYTYKTVQQPIVASYVTPQVHHQGATYIQQQQQYQQPQYVASWNNAGRVDGQVGQLSYGNFETVPKVSSFSYSSQNAHVVEPKQVPQTTYTATGDADYKK